MDAERNDNSEGLLTAAQVGNMLGLAKQTIYHKVSRGEIPYLKIGHNVRFRRRDIERWIEEQQPGAAR